MVCDVEERVEEVIGRSMCQQKDETSWEVVGFDGGKN